MIRKQGGEWSLPHVHRGEKQGARSEEREAPTFTNSAAGDTVLRMSLAMAAADEKSGWSKEQRQWVVRRLALADADGAYVRFSAREKAAMAPPLLEYLGVHRKAIVDIVRSHL